MDTSKEYLEMCQGAKDVQSLWEPSCGDFCVDMGDVWILNPDNKAYVQMVRHKDTWLPRQDQLQEMIGGWPSAGFIGDWREWLGNVYGFNYGNKPNGHLHIFTSGEQLWLAFVMQEVYNKKWLDGEWRGECQ